MPLLLSLLLAMQSLSSVEVPQGTLLHVRLVNAVGSFASRPGSPVEAVLIAPVKIGGITFFPRGSTVRGVVKSVRRVGLGVVHETASLKMEFMSISMPGGESSTLPMRLTAVDNGREEVSPSGTIQEVRTTETLGNHAAHLIQHILLWDVHAQVALWAVKSVVTQVSEPEIYLPPGAELTLTLTGSIRANAVPASGDEPRPFTAEERASLEPVIGTMPTRTQTPVKDRPSDLINLMFVGSHAEIAAAFRAAGWTEPRSRATFRSNMAGAYAFVEGLGIPNAPMSSLLLNDEPAGMAWEKGFNDISKRHHIRLWKRTATWNGRDVWIGSATRDIDYAYFRPGKWIAHKVARQVDRERDKIMQDLAYTSCADVADWWDRPGVPHFVRNATGDAMETDGRLGVLELNACDDAQPFASPTDTLAVHGGTWQRVLRREIMTTRSDLIRHSLYWHAYEGVRYLVSAMEHRKQADPEAPTPMTLASRLEPGKLTPYISFH
jgi:hypothetical protein